MHGAQTSNKQTFYKHQTFFGFEITQFCRHLWWQLNDRCDKWSFLLVIALCTGVCVTNCICRHSVPPVLPPGLISALPEMPMTRWMIDTHPQGRGLLGIKWRRARMMTMKIWMTQTMMRCLQACRFQNPNCDSAYKCMRHSSPCPVFISLVV